MDGTQPPPDGRQGHARRCVRSRQRALDVRRRVARCAFVLRRSLDRRTVDALGARGDEALGRVRRHVGARHAPRPVSHDGRSHDARRLGAVPRQQQEVVGQAQHPVSGAQGRRRSQGVSRHLDGRHEHRALRARCRRRPSAPRLSGRRGGVRAIGREDRHRPREPIKDLEWPARGDLARHGRHAARRHVRLRARPVDAEDVPRALREEPDAYAARLRLLLRHAGRR